MHWHDVSMIAWLTFGSTVLLVGITAWYAVLTRNLSRSARDSARSAQTAAEYAAQSVAAAVAGVKVTFDAKPNYSFGESEEKSLGVSLFCTGATVFIHEARLFEAMRSVSYGKRHEEFESVRLDEDGLPMVTEVGLPVRVHNGESIWFVPETEVLLEVGISIAMLNVQVRYSLDGIGEGIVREVEWYGKHGVDYESSK